MDFTLEAAEAGVSVDFVDMVEPVGDLEVVFGDFVLGAAGDF